MIRIKKTYLKPIGFAVFYCLIGCNFLIKKESIETYVSGPYTKNEILEEFDLVHLPSDTKHKSLFIVRVLNVDLDSFFVATTERDRLFLDSASYRTFQPYSAISRTWFPNYYGAHEQQIELVRIPQGEVKLFWFTSYHDKYVDKSVLYFSGIVGSDIQRIKINKSYESHDKPNIDFYLKETLRSKNIDDSTGVRIWASGPFTYQEASDRLGFKLPYKVDSDEVFLFEIVNNSNENIYLDVWENYEINIKSMYSYSPYIMTSKEYSWNKLSNKKATPAHDTMTLKPGESGVFWDSHRCIWPSTDSLVFDFTITTDKFVINPQKIYALEKRFLD